MNEYIASLFIARRKPYEPKPHIPARAAVEAKRQRRARSIAISMRQLRNLKTASR